MCTAGITFPNTQHHFAIFIFVIKHSQGLEIRIPFCFANLDNHLTL